MIAVTREELQASSAPAVHIKLVIFSASRLKGEDGTRAITDTANIRAADSSDEDGVLEGADGSASLEVVNNATLFPGADEYSAPPILLHEA